MRKHKTATGNSHFLSQEKYKSILSAFFFLRIQPAIHTSLSVIYFLYFFIIYCFREQDFKRSESEFKLRTPWTDYYIPRVDNVFMATDGRTGVQDLRSRQQQDKQMGTVGDETGDMINILLHNYCYRLYKDTSDFPLKMAHN